MVSFWICLPCIHVSQLWSRSYSRSLFGKRLHCCTPYRHLVLLRRKALSCNNCENLPHVPHYHLPENRILYRRYLFALYSAQKWPYHLSKADEAFTDADMMSMTSIFHKSSFSVWLTISERHLFPVEPRTVSPLRYASLKGILPAIKFLLADANINVVGGRYGTAIQAATSQGYRETVGMLIFFFIINLGLRGEAPCRLYLQGCSFTLLQQWWHPVIIIGWDYGTAIQAAVVMGYRDI